VRSGADLTGLVGRIKEKRLIGVATKTRTGDPLRSELAGLAFSWGENEGAYIPLAHSYYGAPEQPAGGQVFAILKAAMEDERIVKVSRNAKADALALRRCGVEAKGFTFDTTVASYVINPGLRPHDLGSSSRRFLNREMRAERDLKEKGRATSEAWKLKKPWPSLARKLRRLCGSGA
jgi:DNA polymerase I